MNVPYPKPWLSLTDQVALIQARGLGLTDVDSAERVLASIGYYRLSGYWYPYRRSVPVPTTDPNQLSANLVIDDFRSGSTLQQVVDLYEFDRVLKLLVMDAIERVEVTVRTKIGYTLGKRDRHAHLNRSHLDRKFTQRRPGQSVSDHDTWKQKLAAAQSRSKEDFVRHFANRYHGPLPVWVATELLDFGGLSYLFTGMVTADRDQVAADLGARDTSGGGHGKMLANWLRAINYVRNICAHHSRLWNRNMVDQLTPRYLALIPSLNHVASGAPHTTKRVYGTLCVLKFLLDQIQPSNGTGTWSADLVSHLETGFGSSGYSVQDMGFPTNWRTEALWK